MSRRASKVQLAIVCALVLAVLSACGGDNGDVGAGEPPESPDRGILKIGNIVSETGPLSAFALPATEGLRLAAEQLNEAGGIEVGGTIYDIEIVAVDDLSETAGAVAAANQLIRDDDVKFIFGPLAGLTGPVTEITQPDDVVQFTAASTGSGELLFVVVPGRTARAQSTAASVKDLFPDAERIALLGPEDQTGAITAPAVIQGLEEAGIEVDNYLYPPETTDLSSILTRIANSEPDVLMVGWIAQHRATAFGQLAAAGIGSDLPIYVWGGAIDECRDSGAETCVAHPLTGADLTVEDLQPRLQTFVDDYLEFTGASEMPQQTQATTWWFDPLFMLVEAMKQAGTVDDTRSIADEMMKLEYEGISGMIHYAVEDDSNALQTGFDITHIEADETTTRHYK